MYSNRARVGHAPLRCARSARYPPLPANMTQSGWQQCGLSLLTYFVVERLVADSVNHAIQVYIAGVFSAYEATLCQHKPELHVQSVPDLCTCVQTLPHLA